MYLEVFCHVLKRKKNDVFCPIYQVQSRLVFNLRKNIVNKSSKKTLGI